MTLKEIIDNLKSIAMTQPDVMAASDGDVYEKLNGNPFIKYSVFHVTQTTHQTDDGWDNYGLSLFVIDRLTDDNSNRLEIQSRAKETLNNIILTFCDNFDAEHTVITFTPFTQKFKDECAGVWCNVTIGVQADYNCPIDYAGGSYYPSVTVIDNKDITITENGVYEVPDGYTGFGTVTVNLEMQESKDYTVVDNGHYTIMPDDDYASMKSVELDVNVYVPSIKDVDSIQLKAGDTGTYIPEGYDAVASVEYEVLPNQDKSLTITENGTYTITYDKGYSGLEQVEAVVDLPIQNDKIITFNDNGTYTITPDDDNIAFKAVTVNVEYAPKISLPNGICLASSTFTTFDMSQHDWSKVYDLYYMFYGCTNLEHITNVPSDLRPISLKNTFSSCVKLKEIPNFDTSNVVDMGSTFAYCGMETTDSIKGWDTSNVRAFNNTFEKTKCDIDLSQWDMSKACTMERMFSECYNNQYIIINANTPNVTNTSSMFNYCENLLEAPLFDTSKVCTMKSMFYYCRSLTTVPSYDTSNVTDMGSMFSKCYKLQTIPHLDTTKVTNMYDMFNECRELTSVTLDLSSVERTNYMFNSCDNLTEVRFTGNPARLSSQANMFGGVKSNGTLYYPAEYDYSLILKTVPSTWTIIPY